MAKIFISYRREDSAAYVGRLFDELQRKFGRSTVFMDIDSIEPGQPFAEQIATSMKSATVVLVAIGRRWLEVTDSGGRRRIDIQEDFVRLEIETALASNLRVIPVLFGGAVPPQADALPEPIRALATLQATEISDARFSFDTSRLIRSIYQGFNTQDRLRVFAMRPLILLSTLLLVFFLVGSLAYIWSEWIQPATILTGDRKSVVLDKNDGSTERRPVLSGTTSESSSDLLKPVEKPGSSPEPGSVIDVETLKLKHQIDLYG